MDHECFSVGLVFDGGFDLRIEGTDGVFAFDEENAIAGDGAAMDVDFFQINSGMDDRSFVLIEVFKVATVDANDLNILGQSGKKCSIVKCDLLLHAGQEVIHFQREFLGELTFEAVDFFGGGRDALLALMVRQKQIAVLQQRGQVAPLEVLVNAHDASDKLGAKIGVPDSP